MNGNMDFSEKSIEELGEWLKVEKFSENTVRIFEGKYIIVYITSGIIASHHLCLTPE